MNKPKMYHPKYLPLFVGDLVSAKVECMGICGLVVKIENSDQLALIPYYYAGAHPARMRKDQIISCKVLRADTDNACYDLQPLPFRPS